PRFTLQHGAHGVQLVHHGLVDGVADFRSVQRHVDAVIPLVHAQRTEGVVGEEHQTRSTIIDVPWPTPTHMVARPRCAPSRSIRPSRVTTRREPLEPSGCPKAMAPPSLFTMPWS